MSHEPESRALLVADTSVLLNFAALDRLDLFAAIGFEAHVPNHVVAEVMRQEHRERLDRALTAGLLREVEITDLNELATYGKLRRRFGDGESASMAIAFTRRWAIAVDEKGPVRRLVLEELGEDLLVSTPKLLTRAVREGVIRAAQVPELRAILAANRYALEALEAENE